MKEWREKPYNTTILTSLFFLLILVGIILNGYSHYKNIEHIELTSDKTTTTVLKSLILEHQRAALALLQAYTSRPPFVNAIEKSSEEEILSNFAQLKASNNEVDWLFLTDKNGILLANYPVDKVVYGKDLSRRDWYKGVSKEWTSYISEVFKLLVGDKELGVALCVPVFDQKGKVISILCNAQRVAFLNAIIRLVPFDQYAKITLIDQVGQVLYSSSSPLSKEVRMFSFWPQIQKSILRHKDVHTVDAVEGNWKKYSTIASLKEFGWTIIVERTTKDIFLSSWTYYLQTLIIGILLFSSIVAFFFFYRAKVTKVTLQVANDELEQSVVERTKELSRVNEKLLKDISQRKLAEENERASKAYLDKILNNIGDPIFVKDDQHRLIIVNDAFCSTFGVPREEAIGKTLAEHVPPDEQGHFLKIDRQVLEDGKENACEETLTVKDSQTLTILTKKTRYVAENGDKFLVGVIRDITDRKLAEEERLKLENRLQQSQKMESIGTLAGGIAHDFNNILTAILGYAQMAKEDSEPESSISKDLDEVLEAGNRAKDLVRQILAFSRQDDAERIHLQPARIVEETIQMLRPSIPTTITITQNVATITNLVFVDPTQLNQILMNLCTNAFHAMEETGGQLDISLKEVTLSSDELIHEPGVADGTFIQFSIGDSGPGIEPSIKGKVFDPYFTTKEIGKGTGMGLATVHGIVKSYGGFISLYSELGEGTVFHVFLPVEKKGTFQKDEIIEQIPCGNERILFVDDEEILATMGKKMLERLGYQVTVTNSSLDALDTFQNQPDQFDLIITDQTMPGMTGSDLSRRMLQIRPDIPIILCTGYSTIISEEKSKAMGIKEFALKPLAKKDMAKLIRKVLDGS